MRAVILEFMDTHCVDICPIVSQEFVDAYHDLGATASHAVFLAGSCAREAAPSECWAVTTGESLEVIKHKTSAFYYTLSL